MKKAYLYYCSLVLTCLLVFPNSYGQNLIQNPSAEIAPAVGNGWNLAQTPPAECSGSSGWSIAGNQSSYPAAVSGSRFFTPGCRQTGATPGQSYELYQDVDVSANAVAIDAGLYSVTFSGYSRSYNQNPRDQTEMRVEYIAANSDVLTTYTTGIQTNISWVQYTDTRVAPADTRTVRIRLIGTSRNGGAVDAYFDDLSLTGEGALPVTFTNITAKAKSNKVKVAWATADEQNNSHFVVEASADGKKFIEVGKVASKTRDGNSSTPLQYEFSFDATAASISLAAIVLLGCLLPAIKRYRKQLLITMLILAAGFIACNKNNIADAIDLDKLFVRVAQVDKDGTKKYSKAVKVVVE